MLSFEEITDFIVDKAAFFGARFADGSLVSVDLAHTHKWYKGEVVGQPGSYARVICTPAGLLRGAVHLGDGRIVLLEVEWNPTKLMDEMVRVSCGICVFS